MPNIKIIKQSGILSWNKENINEAPGSCGVYVLRSSPINGDVVDVFAADNIKENILQELQKQNLSNVTFFDWYETGNKEDADLLLAELEEKYKLHQKT